MFQYTYLPVEILSKMLFCQYFEPEEYFSKQSQKHATSNNTLRKLRRTTKVADKTTQALLAKEEHVAKVHKTGIIDLCASIKQQYSKWLLLME